MKELCLCYAVLLASHCALKVLKFVLLYWLDAFASLLCLKFAGIIGASLLWNWVGFDQGAETSMWT